MNRPKTRTRTAQPTWNLQDIHNARALDLAPVLQRNGYETTQLPNGAVLLRHFRGLIIHQNRWIWKNQHLYGNTIDFFTVIAGKTFHEAMLILLKQSDSTDQDENADEDNEPDDHDASEDDSDIN